MLEEERHEVLVQILGLSTVSSASQGRNLNQFIIDAVESGKFKREDQGP